MKTIRIVICAVCALVFISCVFQPGYRIIIDGKAMSGVYDPETVLRCTEAVTRAADEITRTDEAPPFTIVPVLCIKHTEIDEAQLCHTLLNSYNGIMQVVSVDEGGTPAVKYTYTESGSY